MTDLSRADLEEAKTRNAQDRLAGLTLAADAFTAQRITEAWERQKHVITARCVPLSDEMMECIRRSKELEGDQ